MQKTLAELAKIIQGEVSGDKSVVIKGLSAIEDAQEGDLTFVSNPKYFPLAEKTKASAIIAPRSLKIKHKNVLYADNPSFAFDQVLSVFSESEVWSIKGTHPTAIIAKDVILGKDVAIGAYVVIENSTVVGDKTVIHAGTFVGPKTKIGKNCLIYPNVTIREDSIIGNNVIIHSGTVIGSDGFGYEQVEGKHKKLAQIGCVVIEDDVEIGANVTIDRARFNKTFIGRGTKIDNLVQIAHNVSIGENCIIVAQVGISGSVIIERNCILAGQAGVAGHLRIKEGSVVTAKAGVIKDFPAKSKLTGHPARPHLQFMRMMANVDRIPLYIKRIAELEKKIQKLEGMIKKKS